LFGLLVLISIAIRAPAQQIMLLSFVFSGALSPRERLPGKAPNSPAHVHRRCWPAVIRAS